MSKKEDLKLELRSLIDAAEKAGSFTDEAKARRDEIKKELDNLAELEQTRALMESVEVAEKTPVSRPKEVEVRSIEVGYDNGADTAEEFEARAWSKATLNADLTEQEKVYQRSLDIANDGNVIPTSIMNEINRKIQLESGLISLAKKYSVPNSFSVFDQTTVNSGAVRATDVTDASGSVTDSVLSAITFSPVYLTNEVVISNALARQAGADIKNFVVDELSYRLRKLIETQTIAGTGGSGQMTGLNKADLTIAGQATLKVEQGASASGTITEAMLRNIYFQMPAEVRKEAERKGSLRWIMNESTFKTMVTSLVEQAGDQWADSSAGTEASELKVSGNILKLHRNLLEAPAYKLFGAEILICDSLAELDGDNTVSILLVDASKLGFNTFKTPGLDRVVDLTLARKGQSAFVLHGEFDAKMLDHRALVQFHNEDTA